MAGIAGNGIAPSLTVSGRVITDLANLMVLHSAGDSTNLYATARKGNASAGYQVPVGKQLRIVAAKITTNLSTGNNIAHIGYGDNDIGTGSSSPPTNNVRIAGLYLMAFNLANTMQGPIEAACDFVVPAGKYLYTACAVTTPTWLIYGILENV